MSTLHEDQYTFLIISRWILLRMRNVSGESGTENHEAHFTFNNFSRMSCRLWDKVVQYCSAGQATYDNTKRRVRFSCWNPKAKHTGSEYVILIIFPETRLNVTLYVHCLSWKLFHYQLMHIMLKNTELLKHSKITLQHVSVYAETIFRELQSVLG